VKDHLPAVVTRTSWKVPATIGMLPLLPLASTEIELGSVALFVIRKREQLPEHVQSSVEFSDTAIAPTDLLRVPENEEAELAGGSAVVAVTVTVAVGPAAIVTDLVFVTVLVEPPHPARAARASASPAIRPNRALVVVPWARQGEGPRGISPPVAGCLIVRPRAAGSGTGEARLLTSLGNQPKGETMPLQGEYEPSSAKWVRDQVAEYESSGGTKGTKLRGVPVIVITSLGASSGKLRKNPVMRVEHDGAYAAVASKGGAPEHPAWYRNFVEHPLVELQDEGAKGDYTARELSGQERATWWERAVAVWPDYADYQTKTDREIPVFVLEPADSTPVQ
jgi:F420H(2)-dependent quinone reductase